MNGEDTDRLIHQALAGDEVAKRDLLLRNKERLRRMINMYFDPRISARMDPSDVLQDSMVTAMRKLPDYLETRSMAFYPWIRQIVRDQLINSYRYHIQAECRSVRLENLQPRFTSASATRLVDQLMGSGTSPTAALSQKERRLKIHNALNQLPQDDRELLLMRFFEQLRVSEISEVLSISEAGVKSRIRRSLEKMHGALRSM